MTLSYIPIYVSRYLLLVFPSHCRAKCRWTRRNCREWREGKRRTGNAVDNLGWNKKTRNKDLHSARWRKAKRLRAWRKTRRNWKRSCQKYHRSVPAVRRPPCCCINSWQEATRRISILTLHKTSSNNINDFHIYCKYITRLKLNFKVRWNFNVNIHSSTAEECASIIRKHPLGVKMDTKCK